MMSAWYFEVDIKWGDGCGVIQKQCDLDSDADK